MNITDTITTITATMTIKDTRGTMNITMANMAIITTKATRGTTANMAATKSIIITMKDITTITGTEKRENMVTATMSMVTGTKDMTQKDTMALRNMMNSKRISISMTTMAKRVIIPITADIIMRADTRKVVISIRDTNTVVITNTIMARRVIMKMEDIIITTRDIMAKVVIMSIIITIMTMARREVMKTTSTGDTNLATKMWSLVVNKLLIVDFTCLFCYVFTTRNKIIF